MCVSFRILTVVKLIESGMFPGRGNAVYCYKRIRGNQNWRINGVGTRSAGWRRDN